MTSAREELLAQVEKCICHDRNDTYGPPENSFQLIADFWTTYLGHPVSPVQVADMMELLKIARRIGRKGHIDNYIDGAGYAIIGGELSLSAMKLEDVK